MLVAANFVIAAGFGLVAPALPTFARSFHVSVTAASVVISAFAVARLLFAPASGRLVTALGERRVYLIGISIVAVTTGACAFAANYWQLLIFRSVGGIGSTMFTVSAIALLIRVTPPPMRGRASGLWGTGFLLGNVTGPLLGGGLLTISLRAPFLVYAGMLFIAVAIVWWFLRNSPLAAPVTDDSAPTITLRTALQHRAYTAALASSFANGWAVFGVRVSLVPLFVEEVLRRDGAFAGTALAVFAAGNVAMLIISGRLADSIGRKPMILLGLVIAGGGDDLGRLHRHGPAVPGRDRGGRHRVGPAHAAAAGRGGRRRRPEVARRPGARGVPDVGRHRRGDRPGDRRPAGRPPVLRRRVRGDRLAGPRRRAGLAARAGDAAAPGERDRAGRPSDAGGGAGHRGGQRTRTACASTRKSTTKQVSSPSSSRPTHTG